MKIENELLEEILPIYKAISEDDLKKAKKAAEGSGLDIFSSLIKEKILTEKEILEVYSKYIKVPFIDLEEVTINKAYLEKLPERIASKCRSVVFGEQNGYLEVAMEDISDFQTMQLLEKDLSYKINFYIATEQGISYALDQYKGGLTSEVSKVIDDKGLEEKEARKEEESTEKLKEELQEAPIAKAINIILEYAIKTRASDIHLEPREDLIHIRYRIDGLLREAMTLPKNVMSSLVSRIKIMSNLRIDEHRIPQDGRIKLEVGDKKVAIRVSTLPIMDGEKVVMRILDESTKASSIEELGFRGAALDIIKRSLKRPHGMILVTGPTGSGKSTTLYSIISSLNNIGVNISTVEDPVEYRIQGVNQTQVNAKTGMTFANGLRALLRQDPDIIMVGEIRDDETAEIGVHSALTGHLVLSTLHTNNAGGTLPRLLDMHVEPFLIASTVNTVIAQRLVRKICPHCIEKYYPSENLVQELKKDFNLTKSFLDEGKEEEATDRREFSERKIMPKHTEEKEKKEEKEDKKANSLGLVLYRGKGCTKCENTGYLKRIGIYEVLDVTDEIGELIVRKASAEEMEAFAIKNGMLTMQQDGFLKAMEGLTTVEEVLRVTRE